LKSAILQNGYLRARINYNLTFDHTMAIFKNNLTLNLTIFKL